MIIIVKPWKYTRTHSAAGKSCIYKFFLELPLDVMEIRYSKLKISINSLDDICENICRSFPNKSQKLVSKNLCSGDGIPYSKVIGI